ncbi:MAG: LemA family protein [Actinobacteria bacterium]|nr:LemA family protein [Actinomycetota bacterium]
MAGARQSYNDAVREYDTALESFPSNIVGGAFDFEPREYFELTDPAAASAPEVRF